MSTRLAEVDHTMTTADSFRGKRVVDREGIKYGKVKHIHIDRDTLRVTGVTVHQGFLRDYFLSDHYIDRFTDETLLLSTSPVRTNVDVVDIDGHKIGRIKELHRNPDTDEIESIEVQDGILHTRIVSRSEIWGVGEKVILKSTRAEYKAS